jgi:DNA-binding transcriptional LysR family regulator
MQRHAAIGAVLGIEELDLCPGISRDNVLSMVGAGRGVALLHQGGTGITYPGVVYREVHGADGPVEVVNVACWVPTNDNPALRRFLSLLKERYPGVAASRVTGR